MARAATSRLKVNPPLGRMPVLQFMAPGELRIDASYQRSIEAGDSKTLIRKIAQHWNWDLCQPLVVARRPDGGLFVIDGQHRLEAARMRRDIAQLPCVIVDYESAADEAASFVHLNQQRRPLGKLDLFKAALSSGDPQALGIQAKLEAAGLCLAPHMSSISWKPGQVGNIGGIEQAVRHHGIDVAGEAIAMLACAFAGEVLKYAGTIFPGLVSICAEVCRDGAAFPPSRFAAFTAKLGSIGQVQLRKDIMALHAERTDLGRVQAAQVHLTGLFWPQRAQASAETAAPRVGEPAPPRTKALHFETDQPVAAGGDGKAWCEQCDMRVTLDEATGCKSRWCSMRKVA